MFVDIDCISEQMKGLLLQYNNDECVAMSIICLYE